MKKKKVITGMWDKLKKKLEKKTPASRSKKQVKKRHSSQLKQHSPQKRKAVSSKPVAKMPTAYKEYMNRNYRQNPYNTKFLAGCYMAEQPEVKTMFVQDRENFKNGIIERAGWDDEFRNMLYKKYKPDLAEHYFMHEDPAGYAKLKVYRETQRMQQEQQKRRK